MFRRIVFLALLAAVFAAPAYPQIISGQPPQPVLVELKVRVTYTDGRPAPRFLRVRVMDGFGSTIGEKYTDDSGEANFRVTIFDLHVAQALRMYVAGEGIEETPEIFFDIHPTEVVHSEFVRVKRLANATDNPSSDGSISAATLNIPDKARREFDKGREAIAKNDLVKARAYFEKAAAMYPKYSAAYINLGVISMRGEDRAAAQQLFEKATMADPQNAIAFYYLGRLLFDAQDFAQTESLLNKAVALDPLNVDMLVLLAKAQLQAGSLDLAVANARKVHQLGHSRFPEIHSIAAQALEKKNLSAEAQAELDLFKKESALQQQAEQANRALDSLKKRAL